MPIGMLNLVELKQLIEQKFNLPTSLWRKSHDNFAHLCSGQVNELSLVFDLLGLTTFAAVVAGFTSLSGGCVSRFGFGLGRQRLQDFRYFGLTGYELVPPKYVRQSFARFEAALKYDVI